jgi:PKD repeat protein
MMKIIVRDKVLPPLPPPPNQPPVANLQADPSSGQAPLQVQFSCNGSYDPDGSISSYRIDFGDGGVANQCPISHTYQEPGLYTATLTVTDNKGASATIQVQVNVTQMPPPPPEDLTLDVMLIANPNTGEAPLNVTFTVTASGTARGTISYQFYCHADGPVSETGTANSNSFGILRQCDYLEPGKYIAKVEITRQGVPAGNIVEIIVSEKQQPPPPPEEPTLEGDLVLDTAGGPAPLTVTLTAIVSGTATGPIKYQFACREEDPWGPIIETENTTAEKSCTYDQPGEYTARVKIERQGLTIKSTAVILVFQPTN